MTATAAHPSRRADIEQWLDDLGATWTFDPDFLLSRVDATASLANQVRHEPLDPEVVARYSAAMGRGDVFPPIIVTPFVGESVSVGCGNHRYAGARDRGRSTFPAYIVEGDELVLLRIRVEDNARHGVASTKAERVDHAAALIGLGMSQADASKAVSVDAPALSIALAIRKAEERAHSMDVPDQFFRLSEASRYTVAQVADDAVFEAMAQFAANCAPKAADLKELTRAVKVASVDEALRLIGSEAEEHEQRSKDMAGGVRSPSRSPRAVFDTSLTSITALTPADIAASCPNADVAGTLAEKLMKAAAIIAETHQLLLERAEAA